jgi:hypothetical protein
MLSVERTALSDEVLRRVGRNLVLFQQIEAMLKQVLRLADVKFELDPATHQHSMKMADESRSTLGQLVGKFANGVMVDASASSAAQVDVPDEVPTFQFDMALRVQLDPAQLEEMEAKLAMVTEERNQLAHHFLPYWRPDDDAVMEAALVYLDAQREKVLPVWSFFSDVLQGWKNFYEFTGTEAFSDVLKRGLLPEKSLADWLLEYARVHCRADGWTYLAQAGSDVEKAMPGLVTQAKLMLDCKTLKELLLPLEGFEVMEELLTNGGRRDLFRARRPGV